jgi:hypothetical protein
MLKRLNRMKPYSDTESTENLVIREFDQNLDPEELLWHRDQETRIVESLDTTDWQVQLENSLPVSLNNKVVIPNLEWHRLIKGTGKLRVKIIKVK